MSFSDNLTSHEILKNIENILKDEHKSKINNLTDIKYNKLSEHNEIIGKIKVYNDSKKKFVIDRKIKYASLKNQIINKLNEFCANLKQIYSVFSLIQFYENDKQNELISYVIKYMFAVINEKFGSMEKYEIVTTTFGRFLNQEIMTYCINFVNKLTDDQMFNFSDFKFFKNEKKNVLVIDTDYLNTYAAKTIKYMLLHFKKILIFQNKDNFIDNINA